MSSDTYPSSTTWCWVSGTSKFYHLNKSSQCNSHLNLCSHLWSACVERWVLRLTLCREWSLTSLKFSEKETKDDRSYTVMLIKPRDVLSEGSLCVCVQYFKRNCLMWLIRDVWQLLTSPLHCIELICIAITRAAIEMQIKANMED